MTSKAQVRCKVTEATLLYEILSYGSNLLWFLAKEWVKILIFPLFHLKFDDITVTLSLNSIVMIFFTNSP